MTKQPTRQPVFIYTSRCCDAAATKPPCQRDQDDRRERKLSSCTLGTWQCKTCRRSCKVSRKRRRDDNAE